MINRCEWCGSDPLYVEYHDKEWGVPTHDDRLLFEMLILEGAQAGLSWLTILRKRQNYRRAFDNFDIEKIARYPEKDIKRLLKDSGIVRNRLKIEAAIRNARGVLKILDSHTSFSGFLWQYVDYKPVINRWQSISEIPAQTTTSAVMSKDLKKLDFNFVGPTICYAFMQAVGMVNDHLTDCFRYQELI
ncbi:MAG: DNA-3-methyladenine glycosylase I [Thermodesulfobacteriota bacterium]